MSLRNATLFAAIGAALMVLVDLVSFAFFVSSLHGLSGGQTAPLLRGLMSFLGSLVFYVGMVVFLFTLYYRQRQD